MNALSPSACRAGLVVACAICVFAGGNLPQPAFAAPVDAMQPGTTTSPAPGALALRIGALSERLFDTAAAAQWSSAQAALQNLHEQASQLDGAFEEHFDAVGGGVQDFNAARNSLHADLVEGDIAAGAKDPRALSDVANRVTLIAGELAQPFADAHDAPVALKGRRGDVPGAAHA